MISVCRRRSVSSERWLKCSVKSVSSVREKTPQRVSQLFFFSQKNTDEQNTQHSTETLSQPISQNVTTTFSWNVLWYLYAGGLLWARNVRQKAQWSLCALWEKNLLSVREKIPSNLFVYHLIARQSSIPHRKTRKNRTHRVKNKWYPPLRRLYIIRC